MDGVSTLFMQKDFISNVQCSLFWFGGQGWHCPLVREEGANKRLLVFQSSPESWSWQSYEAFLEGSLFLEGDNSQKVKTWEPPFLLLEMTFFAI